jgi:tetrahydromethanopterin S-methyltransferase subunit G
MARRLAGVTMSIPTDINPPEDHEPVHLTETQIDQIVDRAVTKVFDRIYAEVGRGVVKKLVWGIGLATMGLLIWLASKGDLPK